MKWTQHHYYQKFLDLVKVETWHYVIKNYNLGGAGGGRGGGRGCFNCGESKLKYLSKDDFLYNFVPTNKSCRIEF